MDRIQQAADGSRRPDNTQPDTGHRNESVSELIGGVIGDIQGLVRGEIRLAKTEIQESAGIAARGIGMLVAAALIGLIGFTFLMLALVEVLDEWLPRWGAAGAVALGLIIIAVILALVGKSKLSGDALRPDQTMASLEEDKQWANQQVKSVKN
ncbi:MAG TPA: phage holin family protein [Thermomicrobiales bacterium]|jgi:uncharacterized membrane protein YqjE|nr:phage holin family protein [Thermomicrobiales bacterium]